MNKITIVRRDFEHRIGYYPYQDGKCLTEYGMFLLGDEEGERSAAWFPPNADGPFALIGIYSAEQIAEWVQGDQKRQNETGPGCFIRRQVSDERLSRAIVVITEAMEERICKHGRGAFAGPHEIYGVLAEEHAELLDAVRANDYREVYNEVIDIAVGALFAIAGMRIGYRSDGGGDDEQSD